MPLCSTTFYRLLLHSLTRFHGFCVKYKYLALVLFIRVLLTRQSHHKPIVRNRNSLIR